jgi:hypothetical protein
MGGALHQDAVDGLQVTSRPSPISPTMRTARSRSFCKHFTPRGIGSACSLGASTIPRALHLRDSWFSTKSGYCQCSDTTKILETTVVAAPATGPM